MSHPLQLKLDLLRRQVRRLITLYGVGWTVATALIVVVVMGLLDYLLHFDDRGLRIMATAAAAGALAWAGYRRLLRPLAVRLSDVDLARRVQRQFPELGDRLASAVEFLRQPEDDPTAGSVALRRAVIVDATAATEGLDFRQIVAPRPAVGATLAATAALALALSLIVLDPMSSQIALARLANPFGNVGWPQMTHLALRQKVTRVARGGDFEVEVVDLFGASLPADVRIHYRFESADGEATDETERMRPFGAALAARRENVTRPFSYRIEGGDDQSMQWVTVEIVEPPAIDSLVVTLTPPEYTGWPAERADGHIRALTGTAAMLAGVPTRPLQSVTACLEDGQQIAGSLAPDGMSFTVPANPARPWTIAQSGSYWLRLVDRDRVAGGEDARWEIRAIDDAPPTVMCEQPAATVYATSQATVPLRVVARDDLAVHRVSLVFGRFDAENKNQTEIVLDDAGPVASRGRQRFDRETPGDVRDVTYNWDIEPLHLPPGTQLDFLVKADDYRPQTGQSELRRLSIIRPEELAELIASRQSTILSELRRVLEMERQSRQQVAALEIRLGEVARFDQLDVDHLRGAELNQRQVGHTLASRSDGVPMHILRLLADLENNKLDSPDVKRRMEELLAAIDSLQAEHLPAAENELTAAIKATEIQSEQADSRPDPAMASSLAEAGRHQDAVVASLEQLLSQLSRWDNYRRFHRELSQLLASQKDLATQTTDIARRTLTQEVKDLAPQEQAELKIASRNQLDLGRRVEGVLAEMEESLETLEESDPLAAQTVSDALERARELGIGSLMRTVGGEIERNRMGQAVNQQKEVIESLQEILDILAGRREHEIARLMEKMRQSENSLAELASREDELRQRMESAAKASDEDRRRQLQRLEAEQQQLAEETERMARQLERLEAAEPAAATERAAARMKEAQQAAEEGKAQQAAEKAGEAKKSLEDAARQLADQRRQAEVELAMEQMSRLEDTIRGLERQQNGIVEETQRLGGLVQGQTEADTIEAGEMADLARQQKAVRNETASVRQKLSSAAVVQLALSRAEAEMTRAASLLDRRQIGNATQQAARTAHSQLAQILDALKRDEPVQGEQDQPQSGDSGGQGGGGGNPADALQVLAELKLLKLMQEEVNRRTRELEAVLAAGGLIDPEIRNEYTRLSEEQGRLADLLLNLIPPQADPEEPEGVLAP